MIKKITEEAKKFFGPEAGCHDWEHVERIRHLCLHIGKVEKADLEILECAAVLHDIGRKEEDEQNGAICHAEKGAELAQAVLKKWGVEKEKAQKIIHCVETHRFRDQKVPGSLEAKILFDADKLDSIGAVGIGRAFLFAGKVSARLHNKEADIHQTQAYSVEDTAYREYMVKLRHVKEKMFTLEGKRMALERHDFMVEFFERLDKEVDGEL